MPRPADADLDLYVKQSVAIDPVLVREEYVRLPADLATWNARLVAATERYLEADLVVDRTTARLTIEHRERLLACGEKATEAQVKAHVESDERWISARMDRIEAEVEKLRVRGVVDAVLTKRDMLISLGATIRQELHDPRIRRQARDASDPDHGG